MRLCAVCDYVRCTVCSILIHAVCGTVAVCGSARSCVRLSGSVCGSVRLSGSARGSVRLPGSAAVCGSPGVCIFSNKFKIYPYELYKFGLNQII
jgi:hypothetical protein